jgi:hypothetical protein
MARSNNSDALLLAAIREKILNEIKSQSGRSSVVNNVYGGAIPHAGSGVSEQMGASEIDPGDFDYMVDIERNPVIDPNTGTAVEGAWKKKVHRYRQPKQPGMDDSSLKQKKKRT